MAFKDKSQAEAYYKAYREANKEKIAARKKAWREANNEHYKAQAKAYNEANKEKIAEKKRQYYLENKERIDARNISYNKKNRESVSKKEAEWRLNNKGKVAANIRRYQAAKLQRTPKWLTEFDKLKISCFYSVSAMLTRENQEEWHVDHIIPLQGDLVSGLHVPSNLQIMCGNENVTKSNKFEVSHA